MDSTTRRFRQPPELWAAVFTFCLASASCSAPDALELVTVRDSAGVRIVTTTMLEWEGVDTLERQVVLRIPADDGLVAEPLGMIGDAELLRDGRIAVLDRLAQTVVLYDSTGTEAYRVGRTGQGPGEFTAAVSLQETDSGVLLVYDRALGRITEIFQDGVIGEVITLSAPLFARPPYSAWQMDDDRILAWEFSLDKRVVEARSDGAERLVMPGTLRVVDLVTGEVDTVLVAAAREMILEVEPGRMWFPPFGPTARASLVGDLLYFTTAARHEVSLVDLDEGVGKIYRFPGQDQPIARGELQRLENEARATSASLGVNYMGACIFDPYLQPPVRPAFELLRVAGSGSIWAKRHEPVRGPESQWWVISPDGHFRGRLELPANTIILSMTSDVMLVRVLDEFDVPSLEVWPIPPELR